MTDQSRPVSRVSVVEALARIRALCDEREHGPGPGWIPVDEVRAVLDAVSVDATPAQGIDLRDPKAANAVADAIARYHGGGYVPLSVRYPWQFQSRTWQAIDREALVGILDETGVLTWAQVAADRILALVRPVDGAVISREVRNAVVHDVAEEMRRRSGNQYDAQAANLERYCGDGGVLL